MHATTTTTQTNATLNDLELWTLDDAEAWKEAEVGSAPEMWMDEDPLLDNDLWMDGMSGDSLSVESLGRLGIRVS